MKSSDSRPLSPHLQVYRLPLTALVSISHRATGVVLSASAVLLVLTLAAAANGAESYASAHAHWSAWYGKLFLVALTFALFFHMCNGVRHLFWDIGWGFEVATADLTAKAVPAVAAVLTVLLWLIAGLG